LRGDERNKGNKGMTEVCCKHDEKETVDYFPEEDELGSTKVVKEVKELSGTYNPNKDFTTLKAWEDSKTVKMFFYNKIIPNLPNTEKYNLDNQIRRAAVSITANIAEGYGRYYYQEGIQFYRISRGSLYELKDHLISCLDLNYINKSLFNEGESLIEHTKQSLNGYIRYVKDQMKLKTK